MNLFAVLRLVDIYGLRYSQITNSSEEKVRKRTEIIMKASTLSNEVCLLLCLAPSVLTELQNDQLNVPNPKQKEYFKAATYEHLPILALPMCYEIGTTKFIA